MNIAFMAVNSFRLPYKKLSAQIIPHGRAKSKENEDLATRREAKNSLDEYEDKFCHYARVYGSRTRRAFDRFNLTPARGIFRQCAESDFLLFRYSS